MPSYENNHAEILKKALVRLKLIKTKAVLPNPTAKMSGIGGKSCVYAVSIVNCQDKPYHLIAKFDQPERAEKEWQAINKLKKQHRPLNTIMPVDDNRESDNVIIMPNLSNESASGKLEDLTTMFLTRMHSNTEACLTALTFSLERVSDFHGQLSYGLLSGNWENNFSQLSENNWQGFQTKIIKKIGYKHSRIGILGDAQAWLAESAGNIHKSRIHGDLNLSNLLLGLDNNYKPEWACLIDYANYQDDQPTVLEYVTLEVQFWNEIYPITKKGFSENQFIELRQALDTGEKIDYPPEFTIVKAIRDYAKQKLTSYSDREYFTALFLCRLNFLTWLLENQEKTALALLGAECDVNFLNKLKSGDFVKLESPIAQKTVTNNSLNTTSTPLSASDLAFLDELKALIIPVIEDEALKQVMRVEFNMPEANVTQLLDYCIKQCKGGNDQFTALTYQLIEVYTTLNDNINADNDLQRQKLSERADSFFSKLLIFSVWDHWIPDNPLLTSAHEVTLPDLGSKTLEIIHARLRQRVADLFTSNNRSKITYVSGFGLENRKKDFLLELAAIVWGEYKERSEYDNLENLTLAQQLNDAIAFDKNHPKIKSRQSFFWIIDNISQDEQEVVDWIKKEVPALDWIIKKSNTNERIFWFENNHKLGTAIDKFYAIWAKK